MQPHRTRHQTQSATFKLPHSVLEGCLTVCGVFDSALPPGRDNKPLEEHGTKRNDSVNVQCECRLRLNDALCLSDTPPDLDFDLTGSLPFGP
jgi:hypothetical protein